ncbi:MAG: hypothetical protein IT573_09455 [Deltaproteobacteria bacterium]|nr:hypothetical protein [Deltaproteobacteria bacterium]
MTGPKSATAKQAPRSEAEQLLIDIGLLNDPSAAKPAAPKKDAGKKPAPAKAVTDNGKGYKASQGLKGVTRGYTEGPYGLRLSDAPPLATNGQGIKMGHGIRTVGTDGANTLLAAHQPKFTQRHRPTAPVLRYAADVDRAGSSPSRAAGPKPKTQPKVHTPVASLQATGVVRGERTYGFLGQEGIEFLFGGGKSA